MDWALIESACSFLLAAVSPQVSTPNLAHIRPHRPHSVRRYQKRGIQFRERKTDATLGKSLKKTNQCTLACSIHRKSERPRNRKSTRNDKRKTRNHPFGCVSNMSGVRESDIEYMAAHPP
ncbi:uncharacterized protein FMAN_01067 [Fusarium mangiferae]|uniref:Uncharacterized protein n=1 Tax=Fusarium mangiferae TaxID=192010 RepID=A0A1L7SBG7_FUSMA|nr:uncharacterized protein FMAN_01067 [Fusarium mangiferae]CVK83735.1 uncharacterized protein FMAN_01067 [Fusarium mangiferae]